MCLSPALPPTSHVLPQAASTRPSFWDGVTLFNLDMGALYSVSIVVFGFNCHANVVGVFWELEHYPNKLIPQLPARWAGAWEPAPFMVRV